MLTKNDNPRKYYDFPYNFSPPTFNSRLSNVFAVVVWCISLELCLRKKFAVLAMSEVVLFLFYCTISCIIYIYSFMCH